MKQTFAYLVSFGTIALVVSGIVGLCFHAFRDRGWIETTVDNIWVMEMEHPAVALPLTLAAAFAFWLWRRRHLAAGSVSRLPAMLIYALMAVGAYFISQVLLAAR